MCSSDLKILEIEEKLRNAEIIKPPRSKSEVALGLSVEVIEGRQKTPKVYKIVGSTEADPSGDPPKISDVSPLGKMLLGKKVDEKVEVLRPNGDKIVYTIVRIF